MLKAVVSINKSDNRILKFSKISTKFDLFVENLVFINISDNNQCIMN